MFKVRFIKIWLLFENKIIYIYFNLLLKVYCGNIVFMEVGWLINKLLDLIKKLRYDLLSFI